MTEDMATMMIDEDYGDDDSGDDDNGDDDNGDDDNGNDIDSVTVSLSYWVL